MNVPAMITTKVGSALKGAIEHLLTREYSFLGGKKVQEMIATDLLRLVTEHWKDPFHLDVGQVMWYGVHIDEKPHYGKTAATTRLVPVVLTLVSEEDLRMLCSGLRPTELRKYKVARLFKEAFEQGALLTNSDVAFLLDCSVATVSKDVRQYINETEEALPTRAIIHDIGPTVTHKRLIVRLYHQGMQTPDIARKTNHSEGACDRYIQAYRRVSRLHADGKDEAFIARTLGMSPKLVREYTALHDELEAAP